MSNEQFKITVPITRAYKTDSGEMFLEGIASSTEVDSYETIFNANCQEGFALDIQQGIEENEPVEIEAEHLGDEEPMNILGPVVSAKVTEKNELYIVARLDPDNPKAVYYFKKMTVPDAVTGKVKRFGLSIKGLVEDADWQYNKELAKTIRVFNRVKLRKIGIVRAPSNPSTWVEKLVRSVNWSDLKENIMSDNLELENLTNAQDSADTPELQVNDPVAEQATEEVVKENNEPAQEPATEEEVLEVDAEPVVGETENRSDVVEESSTEEVERTEVYDSLSVLSILEDLVCAMGKLENFIENEKYEAVDGEVETFEITNGKAVLKSMASLIPVLQAIFVKESMPEDQKVEESRDMSTSNMSNFIAQDLSDEVTHINAPELDMEDNSQKVGDFTPNTELLEEALEKRSSEVVVSVAQADVLENVVNSVTEVVREMMKDLEKKFDDSVTRFDNLKSEFDSVNAEKAELIERVAKLESAPASTPGNQITIEGIARSMTKEEELAAQIARAKEKGDVREMIKLTLLRDKQ